MSVTWPQPPADYGKWGRASIDATANSWFTPPNMVIGGNTVSFTIKDNGDGDPTVRVITDPAGPLAVAAAVAGNGVAAVPTLSEWALMLLDLAAAGLGARRLRRG